MRHGDAVVSVRRGDQQSHGAGLPHGTRFHELRHFYASLLIRHGESVKTVQVRLGHASASETLNTYAHLWPDSDDRTREAVEEAFRDLSVAYTRSRHGLTGLIGTNTLV